MEERDFRDLTEAYYSVYQDVEEGILGDLAHKVKETMKKRSDEVDKELRKPHRNTSSVRVSARRESPKETLMRHGVREDYDLVISHLLSEGYATTEDAAKVIMENMSTSWVNEILDEARNVRGAGRSIAYRITGDDIRRVTRGNKEVYKKPTLKDQGEARAARYPGGFRNMLRAEKENRDSTTAHEVADDNARRNRLPSGEPKTIPTGRRLRDRARNR